MSLISVPNFVIAHAGAHLFHRQDEDPPFQCTSRLGPPEYVTIKNPNGSTEPELRQLLPPPCPRGSIVNDLSEQCIWLPPKGTKSWKPKGKGKAECAEACKMAYNGAWKDERWKCWEAGCTDARSGENEAMNENYIDYEIDFWKAVYCDPLGLNATTSTPTNDKELGDDPFSCTPKPNSTHHALINNPDVTNMPPYCVGTTYGAFIESCISQEPPEGPLNATNFLRGVGKEECKEMCEAAYNGELYEASWQCWDEQCLDHRGEHEALNEEFLAHGLDTVRKLVCEPLGLEREAVRQAPLLAHWEEVVSQAPLQDKDSAAGALGAGKTVFLWAAVVGLAFSGFV